MPEVTARGARFHVQRMGASGSPVVFVHGLVMDNLSSFYFTLAAPAAAAGAEVILYDLRGHGRSERTRSGYTLDDSVADLAGVLDALGATQPVRMVGNSFGGLIALGFAAAHPERAGGIVLIDAGRGAPGWGDRMAATLLLRGEERDRKIESSFAAWLGRGSARKSTRLGQSAYDLITHTALVAELRGSRALDRDELRRVRCPVLALYGETSDVRADGEDLAKTLPDCHLRIFPGCSHSVLWEATAEVRAHILAWIGRPGP